jgi:large subunit ribosomal protein L28
MAGNNVPFSLKKTRRRFLPNIQSKRIFVPELDRFVNLRLSTRAMRTMDKKGGLMNYLRDQGLQLKDVL